jgi:hypothetical protein
MANDFTVETPSTVLENIHYYGPSEDFNLIQTIDIGWAGTPTSLILTQVHRLL